MSNVTENETTNSDVTAKENDKVELTGGTETNSNETNGNKETKTFIQEEVDRIVKSAKADAEKSARTKFDKSLEGKLVLTEDDIATIRKEAIEAALKEKELATVKETIKTERKLNDYQVSKLEGNSVEELLADAEKTYGPIKKLAPILNLGNSADEDSTNVSDDDASRKQLFARLDKIPTRKK